MNIALEVVASIVGGFILLSIVGALVEVGIKALAVILYIALFAAVGAIGGGCFGMVVGGVGGAIFHNDTLWVTTGIVCASIGAVIMVITALVNDLDIT